MELLFLNIFLSVLNDDAFVALVHTAAAEVVCFAIACPVGSLHVVNTCGLACEVTRGGVSHLNARFVCVVRCVGTFQLRTVIKGRFYKLPP